MPYIPEEHSARPAAHEGGPHHWSACLPGGKLCSEEQLSLTGVHSAPGLATLTLTSAVGHLVCHPAPPHAHPAAWGLCWQTLCVERRAPVCTKRCARCAQSQQKSAASNVGSPCPYREQWEWKSCLSICYLRVSFFCCASEFQPKSSSAAQITPVTFIG